MSHPVPQQHPTYGQPAPQQPYGAPPPQYGQQPPYAAPPQYGANAPAYPPQAPPGYPPQHQQPQYGYPPQQAGPGYAPQQQQHHQQPYGYAQQPQQQAPVDTSVKCRFCGCVPATKATFRGHQGMIIIMRFLHLEGPYCRDCGLSTFRQMTARTLVQGWWGYLSFVITPITVLINLIRRDKVAKLAPPQPAPDGQSGRPMDPGPPLLSRPAAIVGLIIPFALFITFVVLLVVANMA